eukprot:727677-Pyramimonas_sp.AAC.1
MNAGLKSPMPLVIFHYALQHVCRVCRVFRQPGGHALLVGVGGSGRQSVTRLGAFISGLELIQLGMSKGYALQDWHDDLKRVLSSAGEKGKQTVFLFSDSQIQQVRYTILSETKVEALGRLLFPYDILSETNVSTRFMLERFVEDLSALLNTGEVANLFDAGEQATITEAVRAKNCNSVMYLPSALDVVGPLPCLRSNTGISTFEGTAEGEGGGVARDSDCERPLGVFREAVRDQPARGAVLLAGGERLYRARAPVPFAGQLHQHRLVPPLAARGAAQVSFQVVMIIRMFNRNESEECIYP